MTRMTGLVLLAALLITTAIGASQVKSEDIGFETGVLAFPMGDAEMGKFVFYEFRCHACHRVSRVDASAPDPVAALPGPELGVFQASQNACQLASSLISPSHIISEEVALQSEGQLSPMGDISKILTVRQLIDLVAYLQSLDEAE